VIIVLSVSSPHELLLIHSRVVQYSFKGNMMSFWQILDNFAFSDSGDSVYKISDSLSISSDGTTYTTLGLTTVGSDGSVFIQQGSFSSDGSSRMGSVATGLGAVVGRVDY
jgi:hypothetical protein